MNETITFKMLEPHQHSVFTLKLTEQETLTLNLVELTQSPRRAEETFITPDGHTVTIRADPFSLILLGPTQPVLPQSLYDLHHETLEDLDNWFLVPIRQDTSGVYYQAVFN